MRTLAPRPRKPDFAPSSLTRPIRRAAFALCAALGLLSATALQAATPAGTVIPNQSYADYSVSVDGQGLRFRTESNVAQVRVLGVQAGRLVPDLTLEAAPGASVLLAHQLTNTGNVRSLYDLSLVQDGPLLLEGTALVLDRNGDGRLNPAEDLVVDESRPLRLDPDQTAHLLVVGRAPARAVSGSRVDLRIEATIQPAADVRPQDVGLVAPARDQILIRAAADPRLVKAFGDACSARIPAGGDFAASLTLQEAGRLAGRTRVVRIEGFEARGALIEEPVGRDVLPSATPPRISLAGVHALLGFGEGQAVVWRGWSGWNGVERPSRIGFFLPEALLTPGAEMRAEWHLRALSAGPLSAFAGADAGFDAEGDGEFDLIAQTPCPASPLVACFAGAEAAFALPDFQSSTVEAALSQARRSLIYFTPQGDVFEGDSEASLIVRAPAATVAALGGELTARIRDEAGGDSLVARLTPVPGRPDYFSLRLPIALNLTAPAARGLICGAGGAEDCRIGSALRSRLQAEITAVGCSDPLRAEAMVGGGGVVFVAATNAPLPNAQVALSSASAGSVAAAARAPSAEARRLAAATPGFAPVATVSADSEGRFRLPQGLPVGDYCATAEKPGYSFPSLALVESLPFSRRVDPVVASGCTQGGVFRVQAAGLTLASGASIVGLDLPVDEGSVAEDLGLWVEKSVSASAAQIGDFLRYEVKIENRTGRPLSEVELRDVAGRGLAYAPESLRIDGAAPGGDPRSFLGQGANLFRVGAMEAGATRVVSYVMRVGAAASGELVNGASASGRRPDSSRAESAQASARVRVERTGPLSDRNYLIGRVTVASVCEAPPEHIAAFGLEDAGLGTLRLPRADGTMARPRAWPVAGARVWLETGVYAITDERGYYSVYGLQSGPHVVRLDGETTPRGLAPVSPRGAPGSTSDWSRFVNLRFGDLARSDFHLVADCAQLEAVWPQIEPDPNQKRIEARIGDATRFESQVGDLEDQLRARARGDGDVGRGLTGDLRSASVLTDRTEAVPAPNAPEQGRDRPVMPKSEEAVRSVTADMAREGRWLWPLDGVSRDGRFMAVVRAGAEPALYVNGEAVPESRLGERLHNADARAELVAWYGVPLEAGRNQVEIRGRDPFGNDRVLASAEVRRPGAPTRLVLDSDRLVLPADGGRSVAHLTLRLADAEGLPVEGVSFATLHAEDGVWMVQDLDGKLAGLQVRLDDGEARIGLASSVRSGPVRVTAESEDKRRAELELRFSADDRPLMATGLLAFEANFGGRGWNIPENLRAVGEDDRFADAYEIGARGAVFLKGKIRGDALLTLLYDSSRRNDDLLFRDLDPTAYYPVYGDGSITGYEAQARSPLYVRLEKGGFMGMWGDFATDPESELKLGGLRRNLTGVNALYEDEDWRVQAFAARPEASTRSIEMQGLGLAMGYGLPGAPVRGGSERISLIARDRLNPGIILSRIDLSRGSDYMLDYDSGRLDFFSPVASFDDDLNPLYISASYETEAAADPYTVAGARVERRFGEDLRIGGAYSHVDDPEQRNRLAAVYGEYRPNEDLRLRAEGAWSRNPDTGATGTAVLLEGEAKLPGGYRVEGGLGRADPEFQGESAAVAAGRLEARASVSGPLGELADLRAQALYSEDLAAGGWRASGEAEARVPLGPVEGQIGLRHEQARTGEERTRQTFVTTGLHGGVTIYGRDVSAALEAAKAIDSPAFRASGRLEIQATPDTNVYVKHEFANDSATVTGPEGDGYLSAADAFSQGRTVVGVENSWLPNTSVYSETRLTGAERERGAENVLGLRGDYTLVERLTLQAQAEHGQTLSGLGADSTSVSLGLRDERREGQSRAFRLEGRVEDRNWTVGGTAALVGRVTEELTLLAAARYEGRLPETGFKTHDARLRLGLAFRPTGNRTHVLSYYEAAYERSGESLGDSLNHLFSTHVNARLTDRLEFSGRVGLRFTDQRFDGARYRSDAGLADIRVLYGLTDRVGIEGRAGVRTVDWGESASWSGGLGLNYAASENVEVGIGYNFSGFNEDRLDPQGWNREGVYMRINVKFDEDLFNWLAPR